MHRPQQDHEEQEREPGLGGRVRRFVESELNRVLEKSDRRSETEKASQRADPEPVGTPEREDSAEPHRPKESPRATPSEPVKTPAVPVLRPDTDRDLAPEQQARREEPHREPAAPGVAEGRAAPVGLLNDAASLRERWRVVQGQFVDNPQRAVHEASLLVERTLNEIRANIESKQSSETMSTEELRVSFQHYREFFQRLLSA